MSEIKRFGPFLGYPKSQNAPHHLLTKVFSEFPRRNLCEVYEGGAEHRHGMEGLCMWERGEKGVQKETNIIASTCSNLRSSALHGNEPEGAQSFLVFFFFV